MILLLYFAWWLISDLLSPKKLQKSSCNSTVKTYTNILKAVVKMKTVYQSSITRTFWSPVFFYKIFVKWFHLRWPTRRSSRRLFWWFLWKFSPFSTLVSTWWIPSTLKKLLQPSKIDEILFQAITISCNFWSFGFQSKSNDFLTKDDLLLLLKQYLRRTSSICYTRAKK